MLEATKRRLEDLSPETRAVAEEMARSTMIAELIENLVPRARAAEIADEHRAANTEEWLRGTSASVAALATLQDLGYEVVRPSRP